MSTINLHSTEGAAAAVTMQQSVTGVGCLSGHRRQDIVTSQKQTATCNKIFQYCKDVLQTTPSSWYVRLCSTTLLIILAKSQISNPSITSNLKLCSNYKSQIFLTINRKLENARITKYPIRSEPKMNMKRLLWKNVRSFSA